MSSLFLGSSYHVDVSLSVRFGFNGLFVEMKSRD